MSQYCDICKCNSYERTKGESELDNVKDAKYSCSDCSTQYCEKHYRDHLNKNGRCPAECWELMVKN